MDSRLGRILSRGGHLLLLSTFIFVGIALANPSDPAIKTREDRLQAYLAKTLPPRGLSLKCVQIFTEDTRSAYSEFAVREKHEGACPGDPAVAPIVGRYRVPSRKGRIQSYDVIEDRWR